MASNFNEPLPCGLSGKKSKAMEIKVTLSKFAIEILVSNAAKTRVIAERASTPPKETTFTAGDWT